MVFEHLAESHAARHRRQLSQVSAAIAKSLDENRRISFYTIAKQTGIARSTLYRNNDMKLLITQARTMSEATAEKQSEKAVVDSGAGTNAACAQQSNAEAALRQMALERDLALAALNNRNADPQEPPCSFTMISLDFKD